jgi:two-component sensor histidine kinase
VLKNLSLRFRLALLVAGTTLPLILFAGGIVYLHYVQNREAAFERVLETVRGMRLVLDSEVQSMTAGLHVLSLARSLQRDDFDSFRENVEAFLSQFPAGTNVSLAQPDGRQLLNSREPTGTQLPSVGRETLPLVFSTGRAAYSNLFPGSVSGDLIVVVDVPVLRGGKVIYSLAFNAPLANFQRIIDRQRPTSDWTIAIFDRKGVNFARVPNPEQTVGRHASPTLLPALLNQSEAKIFTTSLEGVPLITAFTRSPLTGWTVAAGIPVALLTAPLWRTLGITAAIGAFLLIVGLAFALRMAARIARGEALQALMVNELNHRVKNTLATVQSIASQTFRDASDTDEARDKFEARLIALGRAHNILSEARWASADVQEIVDGVFEPHGLKNSARLRVAGPRIQVSPQCALILSMALHELATNAVKYGALSNKTGEIFVDWETRESASGERLVLRWREIGGPPVKPPGRKGFGSRLIEQSVALQLDGVAKIDFQPDGVVCTLDCPLR